MPQEISLITAFIAGFLSFFAPCILPLIPAYLAWLLGVSEQEIQKRKLKLKMLLHSALLLLGFSVIFIILGASASKIGQFLAPHRLWAQRIGGLLIILFGLEFAGFLKVFKNHQVGLIKKLFSKLNFTPNRACSGLGHKASSFFVGLTFAFAWVACFSPILGSILVLSSFQGTLSQGIVLLTFYSLGLAVPFLLTALFLDFIMTKLKFFAKMTKWFNLFSGLVLIFLGILLVSDNYYKIVVWLTKVLK